MEDTYTYNNGYMNLSIKTIVSDFVNMGVSKLKDIEAYGFSTKDAKEIRKELLKRG